MNINKIMFALAGLLLATAVTIPAQADPPMEGQCPGGYRLVRENKAQDRDEAADANQNGDRYVCEKVAGNDDPRYIDNNKPIN